jgi:methionyl-tRNA formyltransferase
VPIKQVATDELSLTAHAIDTFTGWVPPAPINLGIAVSFGLLVPPRILNSAKYGGLNVHPSLLPDLRGPAPIEHAVLKRRSHTGVSIQTLDPQHFDRGTILAQTAAPGIPILHNTTAAMLKMQLAKTGADMLIDVLRSHKFLHPLQDVGWYAASNGPTDHAGKIVKNDHFVDFSKHTMDNILARKNALGNLWCFMPNGDRLIINDMALAEDANVPNALPGTWTQQDSHPLVQTVCGKVGRIISSTCAGGKVGQGNAKLLRTLAVARTESPVL